MKTITITIDCQGEATIEANGYAGAACLKATEQLERVLGNKKKRSLKREYFATRKRTSKQQLATGWKGELQ